LENHFIIFVQFWQAVPKINPHRRHSTIEAARALFHLAAAGGQQQNVKKAPFAGLGTKAVGMCLLRAELFRCSLLQSAGFIL
jgi:hypothetical protein